MTNINCDRCGTTFDTDRDGVVPGQDTTRCPSCGGENDVPEPDGGEVIEVAAENGTLRLEIHTHVHVHHE